MDDLTITRLCAEAMGVRIEPTPANQKDCQFVWHYEDTGHWAAQLMPYNPLHDDAQAMALVKKFNSCLRIAYITVRESPNFDPPYWKVRNYYPEMPPNYGGFSRNADLNRAICECVAKLKQGEET